MEGEESAGRPPTAASRPSSPPSAFSKAKTGLVQWLEAMIANDVQIYAKNTPIVEATGRGEVVLGLVNHYYLYRFLAEDPGFQARNHHPSAGDAGAMINVAGVGILDTAKDQAAAEAFVAFLLSDEAQTYFSEQTNEYPLVVGIPTTADRAAAPGRREYARY